jgi:hypothetical protein
MRYLILREIACVSLSSEPPLAVSPTLLEAARRERITNREFIRERVMINAGLNTVTEGAESGDDDPCCTDGESLHPPHTGHLVSAAA